MMSPFSSLSRLPSHDAQCTCSEECYSIWAHQFFHVHPLFLRRFSRLLPRPYLSPYSIASVVTPVTPHCLSYDTENPISYKSCELFSRFVHIPYVAMSTMSVRPENLWDLASVLKRVPGSAACQPYALYTIDNKYCAEVVMDPLRDTLDMGRNTSAPIPIILWLCHPASSWPCSNSPKTTRHLSANYIQSFQKQSHASKMASDEYWSLCE